MDGRTHAALGAASALVIIQPKQPADLAMTACIGMFAAILPDIDLRNSKASNLMRKVIIGFTTTMILLQLQSYVTGVTISQRLNGLSLGVNLAGIAILIAYCVYGSAQPHRGFTHSAIAFLVSMFSSYLAFNGYVLAFTVGYLSHLVADIFNGKGEQLLWPLDKRFCLKLCSANGVAALCLRILSYIVIVAYLWTLVYGVTR